MFDINNINPTNMYTSVILVTPEMAREWLKTNTKNRTPNKDKLMKLKNDLIHGMFDLTAQTVSINPEGNLTNGQHRLIAIAETGIAAPLLVAFNAPDSPNVDTGTKRTQKQSLYMAGIIEKKTIEYDSLTYPLINFMVYRSLGQNKTRVITPMNLHMLYKNYSDIIDPIITIGRRASSCRSAAILYGMLCAFNSGISEDVLSKWHRILDTGDFYFDNDDELTKAGRSVAKLFRPIASKALSITRSPAEDIEKMIKKTMSSIDHFNNKRPITKLYGEFRYEDIQILEKYMYESEVV